MKVVLLDFQQRSLAVFPPTLKNQSLGPALVRMLLKTAIVPAQFLSIFSATGLDHIWHIRQIPIFPCSLYAQCIIDPLSHSQVLNKKIFLKYIPVKTSLEDQRSPSESGNSSFCSVCQCTHCSTDLVPFMLTHNTAWSTARYFTCCTV